MEYTTINSIIAVINETLEKAEKSLKIYDNKITELAQESAPSNELIADYMELKAICLEEIFDLSSLLFDVTTIPMEYDLAIKEYQKSLAELESIGEKFDYYNEMDDVEFYSNDENEKKWTYYNDLNEKAIDNWLESEKKYFKAKDKNDSLIEYVNCELYRIL